MMQTSSRRRHNRVVRARSVPRLPPCARAGVGRVKQRDNATLWGTDAEPKLRQPDDSFWKKYAAECSRVQIAVDVFIFWCRPGPNPAPAHVLNTVSRLQTWSSGAQAQRECGCEVEVALHGRCV